jgi:hypothetical protein
VLHVGCPEGRRDSDQHGCFGNEDNTLRLFAPKIELLTAAGNHLRFVPAELARAMVANGTAEAINARGKVRSIRLSQPAAHFAERIGEPTARWCGPPFAVREKLDCGYVIWRHHPRSFDR